MSAFRHRGVAGGARAGSGIGAHRWRAALAAVTLVLGACRGGGTVDFVVRRTEGDSPYRGADRIVVGVERGGQLDRDTGVELDVDAQRWPVPGIAYGADLRLRVEARAGGLVLARGRSFPFDMEGPDDRPRADVWIGTLGRFGAVHGPVDALALVPAPGGALGVDADGTPFEVRAHGDDGFSARAVGEARPGLDWVADPSGALVGVGPELWVRLGVDGRTEAWRGPTGYEPGTAVVAGPPGARLIAPSGRIYTLGGGGERRELEGLGGPFADVRAVAVPGGDDRVVVWADGALFVVDSSGARPPVAVPGRGAAITGASLAPLAPGLVAVVGGEGEEGPVADVRLVVLGGAEPQLLRPPPLFEARRDPAVIPLRDGLALILGGRDERGPLASAELLEVSLTELPGDVAATGALPWAMAAPVGTRLEDGTALVLGPEGGALYFDPRDPAP